MKVQTDQTSVEVLDASMTPSEERQRTGRYVAVVVAIVLTLLCLHHAWVRGTAIVAGLVVPAIIMFIYILWVLYTANKDAKRQAHRNSNFIQLAPLSTYSPENVSTISEKSSTCDNKRQKSPRPNPKNSLSSLHYESEVNKRSKRALYYVQPIPPYGTLESGRSNSGQGKLIIPRKEYFQVQEIPPYHTNQTTNTNTHQPQINDVKVTIDSDLSATQPIFNKELYKVQAIPPFKPNSNKRSIRSELKPDSKTNSGSQCWLTVPEISIHMKSCESSKDLLNVSGVGGAEARLTSSAVNLRAAPQSAAATALECSSDIKRKYKMYKQKKNNRKQMQDRVTKCENGLMLGRTYSIA